ncbi:hypothetical protein ALC62_02600 [Cyphomyrmex costatus]|uniref:Uncharacterized protein n=1 Tax=Cyphomyrmex costatus TaxID=456900 RepID=A0A195D0Y9_9HYME|nr:hypothetical protein ALC62_02600 [Cyphomyrmex costatus]
MNVPSTSRVRNVANELPRVKSECLIATRRIHECTFRIRFERAICGNGERASEWPCFICKVREEPQLCGGTLSFVIRGGDRLSAVVRFGSNMSYVRGKPAAPADYPELLVGRPVRSVAALTSNDRVVSQKKEKRKTKKKKKSNNNLDNETTPVDRRRNRGRKCAKGAERQLGGDRWKKKKETESDRNDENMSPLARARCTDEPIMS